MREGGRGRGGKERGQENRKGERMNFRPQRLAYSTSFFSKVTWRDLISLQIT